MSDTPEILLLYASTADIERDAWTERAAVFLRQAAKEIRAKEAECKAMREELDRWNASYAHWCVTMVAAGYTSFGHLDRPIEQIIKDKEAMRELLKEAVDVIDDISVPVSEAMFNDKRIRYVEIQMDKPTYCSLPVLKQRIENAIKE